ncbi:MAG: hypothetical protein K0S39_3679 [Paenibacillus sp.]|nr:hypothetical protein [Paenibacillus sp.]
MGLLYSLTHIRSGDQLSEYLREHEVSDKNELSKVLSDPEFMQYYPHLFSEEEVENPV